MMSKPYMPNRPVTTGPSSAKMVPLGFWAGGSDGQSLAKWSRGLGRNSGEHAEVGQVEDGVSVTDFQGPAGRTGSSRGW